MTVNRLLKPTEVAHLLGIALTTLYGWTSTNQIPFRKVGGRLRFDWTDVENWTRKGSIGAKNNP